MTTEQLQALVRVEKCSDDLYMRDVMIGNVQVTWPLIPTNAETLAASIRDEIAAITPEQTTCVLEVTEAQISELERLGGAGTLDDWEYDGQDSPTDAGTVWAGNGDVPVCDIPRHVLSTPEERAANGNFIALAHNLMRPLLEDRRRLQAAVAELEGILADMREDGGLAYGAREERHAIRSHLMALEDEATRKGLSGAFVIGEALKWLQDRGRAMP